MDDIKKFWHEVEGFLGFIILLLACIGIYNIVKDKGGIFSDADCRMINMNAFADTFIKNGNFDYGYIVEGTVKNVGKNGYITITAKLYTSEGDYEQSQKLEFVSEQQRVIRFQFLEPNITTTNVQYKVDCSPVKNK